MAALIRRDELDRLDLSDVTTGEPLPPVTPGDVLGAEFMAPAGISARALARALGVPANRVTEILRGERAVTAETAILLGERFGTSAEFWLNLQTAADLEAARRAKRALVGHGKDIPTRGVAGSIQRGRLRDKASDVGRHALSRSARTHR